MQSCNTASLFIYFKLAIRCKKKKKKKKTSGSGSKFNCAARVGSGRVRRSRVRAGFGLQFKARADLYCEVKLLLAETAEQQMLLVNVHSC